LIRLQLDQVMTKWSTDLEHSNLTGNLVLIH